MLLKHLSSTTTEQAIKWLTQKMDLVRLSTADKDLYLAFSAAPRFVGKKLLALDPAAITEANALREGFNPSGWTTDQAARTLLLLSIPHTDATAFAEKIDNLFDTADMGELVALYASLPLLPHPEHFKLRAAEGVRSNMGDVFEAIAHQNPYPADYLEEGAWNQLVLKTIFVAKPLFLIYGLDKRRNPTLARILSDYAHERWAAGRLVTPELWRSVGPFINEQLFGDIQKLFADGDPLQQEAAALACSESAYVPAKQFLNTHAELRNRATSGEINWEYIGQRHLEQSIA
ncbi:EboA domain-containing protein [Pontibacter sp. SGAir0037]|uniref:EboA domain-containing protein n=1 Tax=Pontibacter sp. SGAir0037 TaxID=2571030 RepID=UPI0010F63968|nr:EboA domain-containing protein [Pontibacter sp. SGAir0037]